MRVKGSSGEELFVLESLHTMTGGHSHSSDVWILRFLL